MGKLLAFVSGIAFIAGIYWGSPYFAAHRALDAAESADLDQLARYTDMQSVRANLKRDLTHRVGPRLIGAITQLPFGDIGVVVLDRAIDAVLDDLVTQRAIAKLLQGRQPHHVFNQASPTSRPAKLRPEVAWEYGEDRDHFWLAVSSSLNSDKPVRFLFHRDGFATWRIIAIILPNPAILLSLVLD